MSFRPSRDSNFHPVQPALREISSGSVVLSHITAILGINLYLCLRDGRPLSPSFCFRLTLAVLVSVGVIVVRCAVCFSLVRLSFDSNGRGQLRRLPGQHTDRRVGGGGVIVHRV